MNTRMTKETPGTKDGGRLSDVAYSRILEILFERKIPAGALVSQSELVELTGVPVAPLRDALRVLQAEGVVTIHPRSGIEFVKPGLELTRSTYQFRSMIESAAVAIYAETVTEEEITQLAQRHNEAALALEKEGLTQRAIDELESLEELLHGAIVGSLNNPLIDSSYRRIHNYLRLVRLDRRMTPLLARRSLREHLAIIEACQRRDPEQAVNALRAHFTAALQRHLGMF